MSMKRFGKAAYRIANELIVRSGRSTVFQRLLPRIFPATHNLGIHVVLKRAPLPRQNVLRIARLATRHGRFFRPFSSVIIERNRFQNREDWRRKFEPLKKEPPKSIDLVERIKQIFGNSVRYNEDLKSSEFPTRIDSYEFGEFLGQGCNAAVYSAKLANTEAELPKYGVGFNEVTDILAEIPPVSKVAPKKFPLAIKLMFNFEHDRDGDTHLWTSMGNELAPYQNAAKLLNGRMGNFNPLPAKHPNVVRIHTAFVDSLKILPDALERYPDALHTARWYESIASQPKTMYVVMRRYRQTLHDYVWTHHRNYWTGRVLIAQLLEACTYLHQHKVSQRDMKSDNILLEYDFDDEIPQLVIADFGCALACDDWNVAFESDDVSLGGNTKTRAPEIVTVVPGKDVKVNFEMADTWAAGGLSYEIITRSNPFYKLLDTATYQESELPALPSRVNFVARDVIFDLLKRDPSERVKPNIAANALNLSLFRMGEDMKQMMEMCGISQMTTLLAGASKGLSRKINNRLDQVMNLITAETIMANLAPHLISRAERQLRATFLSRINREDIWKSLHYFFPPGVQLDTPVTSSDCFESISSLISSLSNSSQEFEEAAKNRLNNAPILLKNVIRTDSDGINGIVHRVRSKYIIFLYANFRCMSSLYVPLVLRLEVSDPSKIVQSFMDDSKAGSESPFAGERTRQRLVKKANTPPKQRAGEEEEPPIGVMATEPLHSYHKGRRTYSEVVVESLDGGKLIDTSSVAGTSEKSSRSDAPPVHVPYYSGNPLTEKTEGIMHFYKYNDEKLIRSAQCRMLCMYAVPAQVEVREIISFMCISLPMISSIKVVRDPAPNQYMLIIKFKEHNDAVTFYEEFNNCPFNDLEDHVCNLFFVDRIECTTSDSLLSSNDSSLTELPTCAVCLERMDDSVLAILCNHSFHANCLEQWADNTCPVCRYIQSPEVVAEQRCSDCGMSNDLWICLICGNIGCGRYAEQHAQRHWELTSHTYSLKVGGERVWDYAGDNYVHRLIENQADGKIVEVQRDMNASMDEKGGKDDKLEGIKLEYTLLLTSQLEDQRKYFEDQKHDMEQTMAKMEKMAYAQMENLEHQLNDRSTELKTLRGEMNETVAARKAAEKKANQTHEKVSKLANDLKDEREINQMLRKDQQIWKDQVEKLIGSQKSARVEYEKKIDDLQSQVNDLLLHFETQNKLKEQLEAGKVTQEEIAESQVGLDTSSSTSSKKLHRKIKKN